jgi:uncharacterized protein (UPF0305 family)
MLDLNWETGLSKKELLNILQKEAHSIDITDIMSASNFIHEDAIYIQADYRKKFVKSYMDGFIIRITDLKNDKAQYSGELDPDELKSALDLLKEQKETNDVNEDFNHSFFKIYMIISVYTTFVLDEPIHPTGTPFPGGFEVTHDGETYFCPVKESQKNNPGAVCGFCIAEQDESV